MLIESQKRLHSKGNSRQDLVHAHGCTVRRTHMHLVCFIVFGSSGDWIPHLTSEQNPQPCCLFNYLLKHIFKMSTLFVCTSIACGTSEGQKTTWWQSVLFFHLWVPGIKLSCQPWKHFQLLINSDFAKKKKKVNGYETNMSFWTNWRKIFLDKCGLLIKVCFGTEFLILLSLKWVVFLLAIRCMCSKRKGWINPVSYEPVAAAI